MQFNTISLCLYLWLSAWIVSLLSAIIRSGRQKHDHALKAFYLRQFIELAKQGKTTSEIVRELYYFFINEKRLRIIMLKAMNKPTGKSLDYIYKRIGCEPMKIIHGFAQRREAKSACATPKKIPDDIVKYFYELIDDWEEEYQEAVVEHRKRKLKAALEIGVFMLLSLYIYIWLKTDISLWIFAFVNTLGVIFFIALDNKTHSKANGLQKMYQLANGMGLIINIFIAVAGWLGPVA
ncbi:MAG: hypothetical protein IKW81_02080 [Pseudobutyrivibrio sp.]|nr:hypothetical protein [Pseudobutyrivibrio sp.]